MSDYPNCTACDSVHTYEHRGLLVYPACGHERSAAESRLGYHIPASPDIS